MIVDIGGGRYAFYAHLKPGSVEVKEGDHVGSGQVLARLGNSGNTTFPHLHFHAHPHLLKNPQPRKDELPLAQSVVTFGAPGGH